MYVIDGIAYADEPKQVLEVKSVRPLDDYRLWLRFSTGETKEFDFKPLLDYPCFKPLSDKRIFDRVYVDYGIPTWDDGNIDIAPEWLYDKGILINN
jgi:hypothetical protein